MTDKEKLRQIRMLIFTFTGSRQEFENEILKILNA